MKRWNLHAEKLWLVALPFLFIPGSLYSIETRYGLWQISDFVIWPYLLLVFQAARKNRKKRLNADFVKGKMLLFVYWAILVTLLPATDVLTQGGGISSGALLYCLLKIAKLSLYVVAGLLTCRAIASENFYREFNWAFLAGGVVVSGSILVQEFFMGGYRLSVYAMQNRIDDKNILSVSMAITMAYILGLLLAGYGSRAWRLASLGGLPFILLGQLVSAGRGGWMAILAAAAYIAYRLRKTRILAAMAASFIIITAAYYNVPQFRSRIDETFWPDREDMAYYRMALPGTNIDAGARWLYWTKEGAKFFESPLTGRGFFNRGASGLDPVGSHNFFIQMFLETGVVGGALMILIFFKMWRLARPGRMPLACWLPVRAAIVAAVVSGFSGEYFYGGVPPLVLVFAFGPAGRLRAVSAYSRMASVTASYIRKEPGQVC
ncbi:MAG: O-antigen ligase family protein [Nitrospiraceae bacterium]|nr:O-antigen ligase family protein [Nitrospiraceae bacterium]